MDYGDIEMEDMKKVRSSLNSQEMNYLKYLKLKEMRKEHWLNKKNKVMA